jgi:hypothetical protein
MLENENMIIAIPLKSGISISGSATDRIVTGHILEIAYFSTSRTLTRRICCLYGPATFSTFPVWIGSCGRKSAMGGISTMATDGQDILVILAALFTHALFNLTHKYTPWHQVLFK